MEAVVGAFAHTPSESQAGPRGELRLAIVLSIEKTYRRRLGTRRQRATGLEQLETHLDVRLGRGRGLGETGLRVPVGVNGALPEAPMAGSGAVHRTAS